MDHFEKLKSLMEGYDWKGRIDELSPKYYAIVSEHAPRIKELLERLGDYRCSLYGRDRLLVEAPDA